MKCTQFSEWKQALRYVSLAWPTTRPTWHIKGTHVTHQARCLALLERGAAVCLLHSGKGGWGPAEVCCREAAGGGAFRWMSLNLSMGSKGPVNAPKKESDPNRSRGRGGCCGSWVAYGEWAPGRMAASRRRYWPAADTSRAATVAGAEDAADEGLPSASLCNAVLSSFPLTLVDLGWG